MRFLRLEFHEPRSCETPNEFDFETVSKPIFEIMRDPGFPQSPYAAVVYQYHLTSNEEEHTLTGNSMLFTSHYTKPGLYTSIKTIKMQEIYFAKWFYSC